MSIDEYQQTLRRAEAILSKMFEAGQMVVSWRDEDGVTHMLTRGFGNYYARKGMCEDFLVLEDEGTRTDVRGNEP